jgi:hypothetical protein
MIKKITLIVCALATTFVSFSQAKFFSNGKQVTELKCDMPDIKVTLPVPPEVSNHDAIELNIDFIPDNNAYLKPRFENKKNYKVEFLKTQKEITIWIKSPKAKSGDLCISGTNCFQIDELCNATYRNFSSGIISVRFYGKDITGYEWQGGQKVPTYKYSEALSKNDIKMNYGDIIMKVSSKNNTFTGTKFIGPEFVSFVTPQFEYDFIESSYSSKQTKDYRSAPVFENPIRAHFTVVDNKKDPSVTVTKDYIKHTYLLQLLKNANKYSDLDNPKFDLESSVVRYDNNYASHPICENFQLTSKKKISDGVGQRKADKAALEKHLKNQEETMVWEKIKFSGLDFEILKLKAFSPGDILNKGGGIWGIKPDAKPRLYYFLIGEKNGKVIAGTIFQEEAKDLTADEQQFIDHTLKTFVIN